MFDVVNVISVAAHHLSRTRPAAFANAILTTIKEQIANANTETTVKVMVSEEQTLTINPGTWALYDGAGNLNVYIAAGFLSKTKEAVCANMTGTCSVRMADTRRLQEQEQQPQPQSQPQQPQSQQQHKPQAFAAANDRHRRQLAGSATVALTRNYDAASPNANVDVSTLVAARMADAGVSVTSSEVTSLSAESTVSAVGAADATASVTAGLTDASLGAALAQALPSVELNVATRIQTPPAQPPLPTPPPPTPPGWPSTPPTPPGAAPTEDKGETNLMIALLALVSTVTIIGLLVFLCTYAKQKDAADAAAQQQQTSTMGKTMGAFSSRGSTPVTSVVPGGGGGGGFGGGSERGGFGVSWARSMRSRIAPPTSPKSERPPLMVDSYTDPHGDIGEGTPLAPELAHVITTPRRPRSRPKTPSLVVDSWTTMDQPLAAYSDIPVSRGGSWMGGGGGGGYADGYADGYGESFALSNMGGESLGRMPRFHPAMHHSHHGFRSEAATDPMPPRRPSRRSPPRDPHTGDPRTGPVLVDAPNPHAVHATRGAGYSSSAAPAPKQGALASDVAIEELDESPARNQPANQAPSGTTAGRYTAAEERHAAAAAQSTAGGGDGGQEAGNGAAAAGGAQDGVLSERLPRSLSQAGATPGGASERLPQSTAARERLTRNRSSLRARAGGSEAASAVPSSVGDTRPPTTGTAAAAATPAPRPETPPWARQLKANAEARWASFEQSRRRTAAPMLAARFIGAASVLPNAGGGAARPAPALPATTAAAPSASAPAASAPAASPPPSPPSEDGSALSSTPSPLRPASLSRLGSSNSSLIADKQPEE